MTPDERRAVVAEAFRSAMAGLPQLLEVACRDNGDDPLVRSARAGVVEAVGLARRRRFRLPAEIRELADRWRRDGVLDDELEDGGQRE